MKFDRPVVLYFVISLIGALLLTNFFLLIENSKIIKANKADQESAARVKVITGEVIRNVHILDLGLRGYAIVNNDVFHAAFDSAVARKDKIFHELEQSLLVQHFPMGEFNTLHDSVNAYFEIAGTMEQMLRQGKRKEFMVLIARDLGYGVWSSHAHFSEEVNQFEDAIGIAAGVNFENALSNSYWLQGILFLLVMPSLAYMAYYTRRSFSLATQLLQSEGEKNALLFGQNETLERQVLERTNEILTQNEEITAQNEEITAHNEQLVAQQEEIHQQKGLLSRRNKQLEEASRTIERQKFIIEQRNLELTSEVEQQNKDLLATNHELVQKNNRIEQFAYIISHNLRAPIARLLGLTSIFKLAKSPEEANSYIDKTVAAASDLDQMVRDLSGILAIQRLSAAVFQEINFEEAIEKTKRVLDAEIKETGTIFHFSLDVKSFYSLPPYIDNILYNLISNAIKYRDPDRRPMIAIESSKKEGLIQLKVSDNGLGIDIQLYRDKIFSLYKRFHFHVEGRGLGLYLVKTQIEMLGGTITVDSIPNGGSTFQIALPIKESVASLNQALI